MRRVSPDVIFCAGSHYTAAAAWTKVRLGRRCPPLVGKVSSALERSDHGRVVAALHRRWLHAQPCFLDRVVAMTPASADAVARAMGLVRADVAVIPNPPARPIPGAASPNLPPRFLLGVGRLVPQKRWDRVVAVLPRLADGRAPLVLLGDGLLRAELTAQAVADRLILPGHAADPLPVMARAAVLERFSADLNR